tara:strand:- start:767 stop:1087 length:321 start_codon:yes stop_codon:yes gene_type:complete
MNKLEISEGTNYAQLLRYPMDLILLNPSKMKYKIAIPTDEFDSDPEGFGLLDAFNDLERTGREPITLKQITGSNGPTERFAQFYLEEWIGNNLRTTYIERKFYDNY